jgi:hypothetical protein
MIKTIHPVIFFQQHTFFIVYILLYNSILNWFSLTLQSLNIIDFFRMLNIFSPELHPLLVYFYSPRTSMISVFLFRKKTYNKFKVDCKPSADIPYFTDDRSIFFFPQHAGFDLSSTSTYTRMKLKKSGIPIKMTILFTVYLYFAVGFFFRTRLKSSMFLVLFFFK